MEMTRILFVGFLALLFVGCGEDEAERPAYPEGPKKNPATLLREKAMAAKAAQSGGAGGDSSFVIIPSESWDRISPFVEKFTGAADLQKSDPFRNNLTRFVELPEIPVTQPDTEVKEGEVEVVVTPLQRFPVEDFTLVMVMSGTSQSKAVVVDPVGVPWVVSRDTPFGNKNGVVQTITQYSIIVAEPNEEAPSEINIRPLILDSAAMMAAPVSSEFSARPLTTLPLKP
jgi:Tfp pilus assembly protein PilP